jgi:hypothetical protein
MGLVGWVGMDGWVTYDGAALDFRWGGFVARGKLASGLADRHRSRLETGKVTLQLLKMEQVREAPIGDRASGTTTHQINPSTWALQATGPGVPDSRAQPVGRGGGPKERRACTSFTHQAARSLTSSTLYLGRQPASPPARPPAP